MSFPDCCVVAGCRARSQFDAGELVYDWLESRHAAPAAQDPFAVPYSPIGGAWTQLEGCQHSQIWGGSLRDIALVAALTRDAGVAVHRLRPGGEAVPGWLWDFVLLAERCSRSDPARMTQLVRTLLRFPLGGQALAALRNDEFGMLRMSPLSVAGRRAEQLRVAGRMVAAPVGSGLEAHISYVADCVQPWLRTYRYVPMVPGPRPTWTDTP